MDTYCGFCAELLDLDTENNLLKTQIYPVLSINSRIIYETDNFVVMPTIGCFITGYVLIVSKQHYDCAGKMSRSHIIELDSLIQRIVSAIKSCYKMNSVVFEHGAVSCTDKFGGCINHAHIHVVPCEGSVLDELETLPVIVDSTNSLFDISIKAEKDESYLFFQDICRKTFFIENDFLISQFFRQLLARKHGVPSKWDWRQYFFLENVKATIDTLKLSQAI